MRHGWEWWEAFWKRLNSKAAGIDVWSRKDEKLYALPVWLNTAKNEFEEEWRTSVVPPKARCEE